MAQRDDSMLIRTLVLAENLGLVFRNHMVAHKP